MKISLLTDGIQPYVIGGMQRHSYFVAKYLAQNGIDVDLYHTCPPEDGFVRLAKENKNMDTGNLEIFTSGQKKHIRSFVLPFPPPGIIPGHYIRRSHEYSKAIYKILRENLQGVDFIYSKGFTAWNLVEEKIKNHLSFPPIGVKFHGLNFFQKAPDLRQWMARYFFRPPARLIMNNADYVFSYGGKITELTRRIGIPMDRIIEIPTGIENEWLTDSVPVSGKSKRFLFVGRYERLKGIEELSRAIKNLHRKYNFGFDFIGPIPSGLQMNLPMVKYRGLVTETAQVKAIMDECDVLCCPSYSEGMPNVILEAMARGLAIIATDVGAINVMVSNENGWLLPSPSPAGIESAMIKAINSSAEELMKKKEKSLEKIKGNFLWEDIIIKLIERLRVISSIANWHKSN